MQIFHTLELLFTEPVETNYSSDTIIQHIQTDFFSLLVKKKEHNILMIEWESFVENYQIQLDEIKWLKKAIQNHSAKHGPSLLLIKTFNGIIVDAKVQKALQQKEMYAGIRAIAIQIRSTTHRLSLNLSSQFNRKRVPIRAFQSVSSANKWLIRKQHLLE